MDRQLVARILDNDQQAMKLLYQRYVGMLTSVCYRYVPQEEDAKDILQNSFVKIFGSLHHFEFRESNSLRIWMTKIIVNESLNYLRTQHHLQFVGYEEISEEPLDEDVDVEQVSTDELHRLIRELPDGYRTVLNLYVFEDMSHREIARMLNIKESTSASQLHYAKQWLAKRIKELNKKRL